MKKSKVSIITPCYNGADVVSRMIESVLSQTYDNIEYIIVNDGSTDDSEKVILSYRDQFQKRGYEFVYIKQENGGLASAINAGLKVFTGDYLCWADADDFYAPESVEKRVAWLDAHPDYSVVNSDAGMVKDTELDRVVRQVSAGVTDNENEDQFWNLLKGNSIFCAGTHMVRSRDFLEAYPDRKIFQARRGQNWQMLLPVYYRKKCHFLPEVLYYYVTSEDSMSADKNTEEKFARYKEHEEIISNTLNVIKMPEEDRKKADNLVRETYAAKRIRFAYTFECPDIAKDQLSILRSLKKLTLREKMLAYGARHPWIKKIF